MKLSECKIHDKIRVMKVAESDHWYQYKDQIEGQTGFVAFTKFEWLNTKVLTVDVSEPVTGSNGHIENSLILSHETEVELITEMNIKKSINDEFLVSHLKESLLNAFLLKSKITEDIIAMEGMTGTMTRHFYNNLLSLDGISYLEIGVWKGSSCCAAMCGNKADVVLIDNFAGFGGPKEEFMQNFNQFKGANNAVLMEQDCFKVDVGLFHSPFDIYLYDGDHSEDSQRRAIDYYLPAMNHTFIFIVDDWNAEPVRMGTEQGIKNNNLIIEYKKEIFTKEQDPEGWWNGMGCFVLKKGN